MAEQLNILELNSGVPATDPTGGFLYITIGGSDYAISYDDLIQFVTGGLTERVRSDNNVAVTAGQHEILFPSAFSQGGNNFSLYIQNHADGSTGLVSKNVDGTGFIYNALVNGTIDYIAIYNI